MARGELWDLAETLTHSYSRYYQNICILSFLRLWAPGLLHTSQTGHG